MKIVYSSECEGYHQHGHPEAPFRTEKTYNLLKDRFGFVKAQKIDEDLLLSVHSDDLVNAVRQRKFSDPDTPNMHNSFEFAKLAAGSAVQAMQIALHGENAFSLMRPPGHHAGKTFLGGFCYFNNLALAVRLALKEQDRIAILDID